MSNQEKYLPIGTVVSLKESKSLVMIMGYSVKSGDKVYDYVCCLFPDGILSLKDVIVFNHDKIKEVYYMGYVDDEWKRIEPKIKELVEKKINMPPEEEMEQKTKEENIFNNNTTDLFN